VVRGKTVLLLDRAPWAGGKPADVVLTLDPALLDCPVAPSKIVCVGRNYAAHAAELGNTVPKIPLWFMKPPSSLLAPGGTVELPPESERVEHEAELAVVIGLGGRRIPRDRALEHVFGYTIACDVTARDLQKSDGQWTRAKGFDTFCPIGPYVVTGVDASELSIRLTVNDAPRQSGNTRHMVFGLAELISELSSVMTLTPGDVILTGTPEGVGPLGAGDRVRIEIDQLGALEFSVDRSRS
jgi:2-keto-4-pentenoate hydratase/2-oxohepta-3-ene-1,7-dioic acid hydratase in catechol pathway